MPTILIDGKTLLNMCIDKGIAFSYRPVFDEDMLKDIITKYKVENPLLLSMIEDFLMDNLGSKTSIRNIANKLTAMII